MWKEIRFNIRNVQNVMKIVWIKKKLIWNDPRLMHFNRNCTEIQQWRVFKTPKSMQYLRDTMYPIQTALWKCLQLNADWHLMHITLVGHLCCCCRLMQWQVLARLKLSMSKPLVKQILLCLSLVIFSLFWLLFIYFRWTKNKNTKNSKRSQNWPKWIFHCLTKFHIPMVNPSVKNAAKRFEVAKFESQLWCR